ncbi:hypothetical protein GC194_04965 [bacterium]|nr:hypothetical protein [bacterium]
MDEHNSKTNHLKETFGTTDHLKGTDKIGDSGFQFYALSAEQEKHFDLILRSGIEYSIPYALIPVYVLTSGSILNITAYDLQITIKGRSLDIIRNLLKKETLIWIKESPSGKDTNESKIFVSQITIEGDSIQKFQ